MTLVQGVNVTSVEQHAIAREVKLPEAFCNAKVIRQLKTFKTVLQIFMPNILARQTEYCNCIRLALIIWPPKGITVQHAVTC